MRPHAEWNVRIQIARATGPSMRSRRSRISPAALFVNVIARISFGFTPQAAIRCATRYVSTRVLPEPAPAITSSGPSVVRTASRWASFRSARYWSGASVDTPSMLAAQAEPPAQGEPAGDDEDHLGNRVPDAFVAWGGRERGERRHARGDRTEQAVAPRYVDGQIVEDVARL